MTTTCHGQGPQFVHLSEAEVRNAMAEDVGGSVRAEVTRLVAELTIRLMARAERGLVGLLDTRLTWMRA